MKSFTSFLLVGGILLISILAAEGQQVMGQLPDLIPLHDFFRNPDESG